MGLQAKMSPETHLSSCAHLQIRDIPSVFAGVSTTEYHLAVRG
jgi:hypothetical protein